MFDFNVFKRSTKEWIRSHPEGTLSDLTDFCEETIPPHHYAANQWLIEETLSWYKHILSRREEDRLALEEVD
jgi:hypothetical protein